MRILLLGKNGHIGWELQRTLAPLGGLLCAGREEVDLSNIARLREFLQRCRPNLIVNAAAYTRVDQAEDEKDLAYQVNATAPEVMAQEAQKSGAALIHYSTDYVFDGFATFPYRENHPAHPLNEYGRSKLAGEQAINAAGCAAVILRTSWNYSLRRTCFLTQILKWARTQENLHIVNDQVGSPTWARALAEATARLVASAPPKDLLDWFYTHSGIYHLAGNGSATRYEFATKALDLDPAKEEHIYKKLHQAKTCEFPTPAARPAFSALDCSLFFDTFGFKLPPWEESLALALQKG